MSDTATDLLNTIAALGAAIDAVTAEQASIIACHDRKVIRALNDASSRLDLFAHDTDNRWADRHVPVLKWATRPVFADQLRRFRG